MTALHPKHAFNVVPGQPQPTLLDLIFRRVLRMPWRKPAAPGTSLLSGAAAVLLANRNAAALGFSFRVSLTPEEEAAALAELGQGVLGDRMISEVREQWNAWHDGLSDTEIAALAPRRVLPREDGDVIIDQRERVHLRPWDYPWPRAEKPAWAQPPEPHRADDTRVDLRIARPYAPQPVYGQAPAADVLEAERLAGRVIA